MAKLLLCKCAKAMAIPAAVRDELISRLRQAGVEFATVDDLCGLAARRDGALAALTADGQLRIAACHRRAVRWLLHFAGVDRPEQILVADLRTTTAEQAADMLLGAPVGRATCCSRNEESPISLDADAGPKIPWFPVIDYDRCIGCKQCLNFCLFGVYALEDGQVRLKNPDHCKLFCPACARVCPAVAIIFPKYDQRPFNGDEVTAADLARPAAADPKTLREGAMMDILRARSGRGMTNDQ